MRKFLRSIPTHVYAILLAAFVIRIFWLPENFFFGYEQGRDMLAVRGIVSGDLSLIGPWTSIPGFFHGALSYWLIVPMFILGSGDPIFIMTVLILTNILGIYLFYKATAELYKKEVATISTLLISVSYLSVIYARWFSNPTLVPAFIFLLYFSLVKSRKNDKFLLLAVLAFAVVFHLQSIVAVTLSPVVLALIYILKIKIRTKRVIQAIGLFVMLLASYIIFDIRNDFIMSHSLLTFLKATGGSRVTLHEIWIQLIEEVQGVFFLESRLASVLLLVLCLNRKAIIPWLFILASPLFFLVVGIMPLNHYLMPVHLFLPLALAIGLRGISKYGKIWAYVLVALVVFSNVKSLVNRLPENTGIFLYHAQRTYLGDMKNLLDYVYKDAGGREFSYDYYSVPYWHNEAWEYMFVWYGQGKYDYFPSRNRTKIFYVLIEPDETQPKYQEDWYAKLSAGSVLLEEHTSGKLKVEKREEK